jgi:hypothetical protein
MGTELVPETLYLNELTRLCAREDCIESCRRESFKTYSINIIFAEVNKITENCVICITVGIIRVKGYAEIEVCALHVLP